MITRNQFKGDLNVETLITELENEDPSGIVRIRTAEGEAEFDIAGVEFDYGDHSVIIYAGKREWEGEEDGSKIKEV